MLIGVLKPWSSRCGPISKVLLCSSNLKGIGTSVKIYANENLEYWPTPAFDKSMEGKIDYRVPVGGGAGNVQSPNRMQQSLSIEGGARELTVSRALWMLVRTGDITTKQVLCPQSTDVEDPTQTRLDDYYDFSEWKNLSYGYQVPYGVYYTRASERAPRKMILAADKGPYRDATVASSPPGINSLSSRSVSKPNERWKPYNSLNHGGDGQNVLYADGHSDYQRTPIAGIDGDNIYTIALDSLSEASRMAGESPWLRASQPFSWTDSVIVP
jgi:prepilin-type processing-associated H-X9-DG protein